MTLGLLIYFPFFIGQFALLSYFVYIVLSVLFGWMLHKLNPFVNYVYIIHVSAFLIAYSFFAYIIYNFATINHFGF